MSVHEPGVPRCESPRHEGDRRIREADVCFEISGFETPRSAGGTNHVELRERTGMLWCRTCVDVEKLVREHGGVPGKLL